MKSRVVAYIIVILLLIAVDYGAVREIASGKSHPAFAYLVMIVSTLIVATLIARLYARRK